MTEIEKSNIERTAKKSYYSTNIEISLDWIQQVHNMLDVFEKDGEERIKYVLDLKCRNNKQIQSWNRVLRDANQKMQNESERIKELGEPYVKKWATECKGHFSAALAVLTNCRSHMSALKSILKRSCPSKHPTSREQIIHNIPSRSVFNESPLVGGPYQGSLYAFTSDYYQDIEIEFCELVKRFFDLQLDCIEYCQEIIEQEKEQMQDGQGCLHLLKMDVRDCIERMNNCVYLVTSEMIATLKNVNPIYQERQKYATLEDFAKAGYHKYNTNACVHYALIDHYDNFHEKGITMEDRSLFGDNPDEIRNIYYVVEHFDEILPPDLRQTQFGDYIYCFCKWALNSNISKAFKFFEKNYKGKFKLIGYKAVSCRSADSAKNKKVLPDLNSAIQTLLKHKDEDEQVCRIG